MSSRHRLHTSNARAARAAMRDPDYQAALVELNRDFPGTDDRPRASASGWNWRGGAAPLFDGSKYRDALRTAYPSGYDLDYAAIRGHARAASWDSTYARAILRRLVDTVIGTGLSAAAAPLWDVIGGEMSDEAKASLSRKITQQFHLYMQSHEPDATGRMTGYELQAFQFLNELRDGEAVIIQRFSGERSRMSPLNLQFIDPAQVADPFDGATRTAVEAAGRVLTDGVETDVYGREIAFHVLDPRDLTRMKYTRIPVVGPSGRRFVLHPGNYELVGQVRGVSVLAPVVHELQKITDYSVLELEAAVVNALIIGYEIAGDSGRTSGFGGGIRRAAVGAAETETAPQTGFRTTKIDKGGVWISRVPKGGDIKSFDTKRPNVNFETFVKAVARPLSASLGIPLEVVEMIFSNNYSASRASLILFWQRVEGLRSSLVSQFLQHWYDTWFTEAHRAGRFEAPGFADGDPIVRAAWLNANWIGDSMPSIDPLKDAQADDARIKQGATTRGQVAMEYNGSSYEENARLLKRENELLAESNMPAEGASAPAPAGNDAADGEDEERVIPMRGGNRG